MKKLLNCLVFFTLLTLPATAQRIVKNFNFGWKFHLGQVDPQRLDTTGWRNVNLPHDFQIEQPWVKPSASETADASDGASNFKSRLSARGFKEMGDGWYVKVWKPDSSLKGRRVLLDFEGIMYVGDVYLNGERVGGTDYGYVGFDVDLSQRMRIGENNVIAVHASTSGPTNSRWYTGGGLFRDVHLISTDTKQYFVRHPLYVTTKDNQEINLQIEVANLTKANTVDMLVEIVDRQGAIIYSQRRNMPFNRKARTNEIKWEPIHVTHAHLWNTDDPYLYTARVTLYNYEGKAIDEVQSRFGIRTIEIGPAFGLKLNGKKLLLKGIANHHTLGSLGAAAYPRAMEKRLKLLKSFGFNHVRTSHNPYSESFLNLCDSMGIIVVDELYDKWLTQYTGGHRPWLDQWSYDLPEWIKRDRNHPSVVMWSLGNELQTYPNLPFNDWGVTPYKMLRDVLLRYDNTRKTTVAMHPRGRNLQTDSLPCDLAMITDVQAYNYRWMYFKPDSQKFPWMTFYQSEANLTTMGENFFGMDLNKVIGLAYWGMIDYLGESRGWPAKGWTDGIFDISLQPKPKAWLAKAMFLPDEPVCHIAVIDGKARQEEWNGIVFQNDGMSDHWNRTEGEPLSVVVYTNGDHVELFENGKKIAEKDNTHDAKTRDQIRFDGITYHAGNLEAVAYKDGHRIVSHRIETAGKAIRLNLIPDQETWHADGTDLMHVRIVATDRHGRRVPTANNKLHFSIEGDARIIAVDNGNMLSDELHVPTSLFTDGTADRSLFSGSALVILRAGQHAGKVVLTVSADGFKSQRLVLKTQ